MIHFESKKYFLCCVHLSIHSLILLFTDMCKVMLLMAV